MRDVWDRLGPPQIRIPRSNSSSSTPTTGRARPRSRRVVAELLALRGVAGDFVVPAGRGRLAPAPRLQPPAPRPRPHRPRRPRRSPSRAGSAGVVGERRTLTARPGDRVLLDYLSTALGEPGLVFAGTDRPCREFVTPVLQLFTADGRCVGFAKIGWDPVTQRMIDDEADALRRVRAAAPNAVRVPEVLWHGYWQGLAVMVTAPMPTDIRRLPRRARVPVDPLAEIAAVDGPVAPTPLGTSDYLRAATETGVRRGDRRTARACCTAPSGSPPTSARSTSRSDAGTATGSRGTSAASGGIALRLGLGLQRDRGAARLRRAALRRHPGRGARAARAAPRRRRTPPR